MPPPGVCMNIMTDRYKAEGMGTPATPVKFCDQDFYQLHQFCLIKGVRYIDELFPPDTNSIGNGLLTPEDIKRVVWIRPTKLERDPCLIVKGVSRFDFAQGAVGNCWFLASLGALTFQDHILNNVLPLDQGFQKDYAGIFHFRFWRFGKWVDVVIDDKLPTIDGTCIFVHAKTRNEFWPALLEKAYAKVCGSYADMHFGDVSEALMDFTGGVHITFQLQEQPAELWDILHRAVKSKALMACGSPSGKTQENTVLPNGIVKAHAYTVTGVALVMNKGRPAKLLRLWNPWGKGEWNGDWSDYSPLWQNVPMEDRANCLKIRNDGEFWISMEDFCKTFSEVYICALCPDFVDGSSPSQWSCSSHDGRWVAGTTAGGCMEEDTFWTNPQYRVQLTAIPDKSTEHNGSSGMVVSLMQKPDKRNRHLVTNLHIGFTIFMVTPEFKNHRGKFPAAFFNNNWPVARTKDYLNVREVMEFFLLKPGDYVIVPSTFGPNETASFILTIHSKTKTHMEESSSHAHVKITKETRHPDRNEDTKKNKVFRQYSDQYEEVDAELLQRILNENFLKGVTSSVGFGLDTCRSMVALIDLSVTGKLNSSEFIYLWKKLVCYKETFFKIDVSHSGTMSVHQLRDVILATGTTVSDDMLNLMVLRYSGSSGYISLESFISLMLRLSCMAKIFRKLSDGRGMNLREKEWLYLTMYS